MTSGGSSSSSPNLAQLASSSRLTSNGHTGSSSTPDRRSADVVMLAKPAQSPALTRVSSNPLSQSSDESKLVSPAVADPSSPSEDPSAILTLAPPKPGPADTLYPSPSGGFVPSPEEGQDWRLKPPPARKEWGETPRDRFEASKRLSPTASRPGSLDLQGAAGAVPPSPSRSDRDQRPGSLSSQSAGGGAGSRLSPTAPTRPPSIPPSQETASLIADASSASLSRRSSQASQYAGSPRMRPLSSASSLSRRGTAASSKDASPASPSARKRRSTASAHSRLSERAGSTTSICTAQQGGGDKAGWAPIVVRDFAFDPADPRFAGQREAGLGQDDDEAGSRQFDEGEGEEGGWGDLEGYEDEDEDEFVGDEGDQAHVAEGVYRVVYEFVSESEHELSVEAGETVRVVGALEGGWAIVTKESDQEVKGIVPATYLEWMSDE
ncbi:uncharacterized protein PFL1_06751 [Pseudozyma flocculosa PF-1]|uniref:SH3 domain-containing protein n=2 Tax=Pseudozyma flocculosa TaxID=84751 RepID=A0A5C3F9Y5_9BASI|nr:uncharacterized protein PFL1_06751 [Pseudozyma flocculosa PF-1]EPQ25679.1 hypothetical protein PFL1_06751 [Pseudozyma flocculosa PF-1]SPO40455.1 uncharacterized protein PSFLO_05937 [Pseudozyma flocculosa]